MTDRLKREYHLLTSEVSTAWTNNWKAFREFQANLTKILDTSITAHWSWDKEGCRLTTSLNDQKITITVIWEGSKLDIIEALLTTELPNIQPWEEKKVRQNIRRDDRLFHDKKQHPISKLERRKRWW